MLFILPKYHRGYAIDTEHGWHFQRKVSSDFRGISFQQQTVIGNPTLFTPTKNI